jgi:hypothetical protein
MHEPQSYKQIAAPAPIPAQGGCACYVGMVWPEGNSRNGE